MRYICHTTFLGLTALLLNGCGPDTGSGGSAFNPATSVSLSLETFRVQDEGGNPHISRTIFADFYEGIEPAEGENDRGAAEAIRERLNLLMGLTPSEDGKSYSSTRNPLDLIHHLIHTDQISTFNDGKRLMQESITSGNAATYNTSTNGGTVKFTDLEGRVGEDPGPDQVWEYGPVAWISVPITTTIRRVIQFTTDFGEDGNLELPEIKSAGSSTQFDGNSFSATGYNKPEFINFNATGRRLGGVDFYSVFANANIDTLYLTNTSEIIIDGEEPVFVCAQIDYDSNLVRVSYVIDPEADTRGTNPDPSQCPIVGTTFTYSSEQIDSRQ